jgi:hypothetical protein
MAHLTQFILSFAGIISALGVILAFWAKIKKRLFKEIYEQNEEIKEETKILQIEIKRQVILELIHHDPTNTQSIMWNYDEYKKMWGNSYIDHIYYLRKLEYLDKEKDIPILSPKLQVWNG